MTTMANVQPITETSDKNEILTRIHEAESGMQELMSPLSEKEVNTVPYKDSWTAGMLFRHVSKSMEAMSKAMQKDGEPAKRDPAEKIPELKNTFLDFSTKMDSPDFIVPEEGPYEKRSISDELNNSYMHLKESATHAKLSELAKGLPLGDITKLEILHFSLYHTKRHLHQMTKICGALKNK